LYLFYILFEGKIIPSTFSFNIFTGIAIDEIKSLIADSNVQIMKDKITYIYESSILDTIPCNKRLFKMLKHVFKVEVFVTNVKECCLDIICGKSNQVEISNMFINWIFSQLYVRNNHEFSNIFHVWNMVELALSKAGETILPILLEPAFPLKNKIHKKIK